MAEVKEGTSGGVRVSLHPLAIVAISDHFTGIQAGGRPLPPGAKCLGLLWGKQEGQQVETHFCLAMSL